MKSRKLIHATDCAPQPGQQTITAVCGSRVSVNMVLQTDNWPISVFRCVGCLAILNERQREFDRARIHALVGGAS